MVLRVIWTPYKEEEIQCPHCKSILAYTHYDIYSNDEELFGEWHSYEYVRCPVCKERIII